eukprot:11306879-Alexandrium_andersonii.AAC.1
MAVTDRERDDVASVVRRMHKTGPQLGNGWYRAHAWQICSSMLGTQLDARVWQDCYNAVLSSKMSRSGAGAAGTRTSQVSARPASVLSS